MAKKKSPGRKEVTATQLPDIEPILDAYLDVYAILRTASYVLHNADEEDGVLAVTTLRQGIAGLYTANDRLEEAQMAISRIRRAGGES